MLEQVPAENSIGKRGRSLGGFFYGNPLVVREFFGFILLMAVSIMKTGPLKLDVIRRGHNSDTDKALASMAHWTTIHLKLDTALVGMRAGELPAYSIGTKSFVRGKRFLSGEHHQFARFLTEFIQNDFIIYLGPLSRRTMLDNPVFQNSARPLSFLR